MAQRGDARTAHSRRRLAKRGKPGAQYAEVVQAAAKFLRQEDGPQVAVFDTTGWDTHFNEGGAKGQLAARLAALDAALGGPQTGLGPGLERHRRAAGDGVRPHGREKRHARHGSRHGDRGVPRRRRREGRARGGGLARASRATLYQDRDLRPTLDLRSVMKGVLAEQLDVPERALESSVFPESGQAQPLRGCCGHAGRAGAVCTTSNTAAP